MLRGSSWPAGMATVVAWSALGVAAVSAQNSDDPAQSFAQGVHAYHAGDSFRAESHLTRAIDLGSKDPRAYYFRALARLRTGDTSAAESDMLRGATLEVEDEDRFYPVNRSLERVQGQTRLMLERYRRRARSTAKREKSARQRERYEALTHREDLVLRRRIVVPLERLASANSGELVVESPLDRPTPEDTEAPATHPAGVKPVPPPEKIAPPKLGEILTRILNKALPDAAPSDPFVNDEFPQVEDPQGGQSGREPEGLLEDALEGDLEGELEGDLPEMEALDPVEDDPLLDEADAGEADIEESAQEPDAEDPFAEDEFFEPDADEAP